MPRFKNTICRSLKFHQLRLRHPPLLPRWRPPIKVNMVAKWSHTAIHIAHKHTIHRQLQHVLFFPITDFNCDLLICMRVNHHNYSNTVKPSTTCPKCGTMKNSKKLSCCVRGGAWFKNCGDVGDSKFDHTWPEGVQACKGKPRHVEIGILPRLIISTIVFVRISLMFTHQY